MTKACADCGKTVTGRKEKWVRCRDCYDRALAEKRANPEHGKYATYRHAGCRCEPCRDSRREFRTEADKVRMRAYMLQRYGINMEQYVEMWEEQDGVCAICGEGETRTLHGKVVRLSVDHDHVTGAVRGLLCNRCNTLLGRAGDDPDVLFSAAMYLQDKG